LRLIPLLAAVCSAASKFWAPSAFLGCPHAGLDRVGLRLDWRDRRPSRERTTEFHDVLSTCIARQLADRGGCCAFACRNVDRVQSPATHLARAARTRITAIRSV